MTPITHGTRGPGASRAVVIGTRRTSVRPSVARPANAPDHRRPAQHGVPASRSAASFSNQVKHETATYAVHRRQKTTRSLRGQPRYACTMTQKRRSKMVPNMSQGSVPTHLRCAGIFSDNFITLLSLTVKTCEKRSAFATIRARL